MAILTVQRPGLAGAVITLSAAAAGGDNFPNNGETSLVVNNGGASPVTVTVDSKTPCDYGQDHNVIVVVAAGQRMQIGPFATRRFGDQVDITYSGVTSVTVGAVSN